MSRLDWLCEHCHGLLSTQRGCGWQGLWNNRVGDVVQCVDSLSYTVKWTSLLNTISSFDQKLYRLKVGMVICHEYTDLDANLCIRHFLLSTSSCGQEIRTSQSWKPNHCACLLNSRIIPFMFFFFFFFKETTLLSSGHFRKANNQVQEKQQYCCNPTFPIRALLLPFF